MNDYVTVRIHRSFIEKAAEKRNRWTIACQGEDSDAMKQARHDYQDATSTLFAAVCLDYNAREETNENE